MLKDLIGAHQFRQLAHAIRAFAIIVFFLALFEEAVLVLEPTFNHFLVLYLLAVEVEYAK